MNCLSVFDHFVILALKGLSITALKNATFSSPEHTHDGKPKRRMLFLKKSTKNFENKMVIMLILMK